MDVFYTWLSSHWLYFIGAILSLMAAFGFLVFLRGFLLGINQLVYIDGHAEHVDHARTRVTWGLLIMINAFVWWVLLRGIIALFGGAAVNTSLTFWILGVYTLLAIIFLATKK